jgi:hypothetical protein
MKSSRVTPRPRAVVFIGKSKAPGEDALLIEVQKRACLDFIKKKGWLYEPETFAVAQMVDSPWSRTARRRRVTGAGSKGGR